MCMISQSLFGCAYLSSSTVPACPCLTVILRSLFELSDLPNESSLAWHLLFSLRSLDWRQNVQRYLMLCSTGEPKNPRGFLQPGLYLPAKKHINDLTCPVENWSLYFDPQIFQPCYLRLPKLFLVGSSRLFSDGKFCALGTFQSQISRRARMQNTQSMLKDTLLRAWQSNCLIQGSAKILSEPGQGNMDWNEVATVLRRSYCNLWREVQIYPPEKLFSKNLSELQRTPPLIKAKVVLL